MKSIPIFNTGYEWNWVSSVSYLLDGIAFACGILIIFILTVFIFSKFAQKTNKDEEKTHSEERKIIGWCAYDPHSKNVFFTENHMGGHSAWFAVYRA